MKYNLHALEVAWEQRPVATLETDPSYKEVKKEAKDNNLAR